LLSAALLERWPQVCRVKITFSKLPTNRFGSSTKISMKCIVNWIPLRIRVRSRNTQAHLKSMVHYVSAFEPGASGLPYYCTPPVTAPDEVSTRAVWWQNTKQKNEKIYIKKNQNKKETKGQHTIDGRLSIPGLPHWRQNVAASQPHYRVTPIQPGTSNWAYPACLHCVQRQKRDMLRNGQWQNSGWDVVFTGTCHT